MCTNKYAINWIEVVAQIMHNKGEQNPLLFNNHYYGFAIFGYPDSKLGFMTVWNTSNLRAIRISRIKIPNGVKFLSMDGEGTGYDGIVPSNLKFEEAISD